VLPPAAQVVARNRTVLHLESRWRTSYVATGRAAISSTLLDLRFVRARPPRSRQYLIRMARRVRALNKEKKFTNLVFYRKALNRRLSSLLPIKER